MAWWRGPSRKGGKNGLPPPAGTPMLASSRLRRRSDPLLRPRRIAQDFCMISNSTVLDTRFRIALDRMAAGGRLEAYTAPIDPQLEVAGVLKKRDGGSAMLFTDVRGHDVPVVG